jgi:hypothetical protein
MRCANGHESPDGQPFCGQCGEALDAASNAPATDTTTPTGPINADPESGVAGAESSGVAEESSAVFPANAAGVTQPGSPAESILLAGASVAAEDPDAALEPGSKKWSKKHKLIADAWAAVVVIAVAIVFASVASGSDSKSVASNTPNGTVAATPTTQYTPPTTLYTPPATTLYTPPPTIAPITLPPTTAPPPTAPPVLVYEVTGDGSADLTIENASGGTEQKTVNLPYSEELTRPPDGFVYLSAQLGGSGSVSCNITYGGRVVQQASSSGDYVIASCSGSI